MVSRQRRRSSIGFGSSAYRFSRPARTLRTTPAASSTRRCLVTAWRVSRVPAVRRTIDCGVPRLKRSSTESRVASPSAAKISARDFNAVDALARMGEILRDIDHLDGPTALVHAERFVTATCGQFVEARLDNAQNRPGYGRLKRELDQRRRLGGIILARVDRIGMPREGEQPLGLDLLNRRFPNQIFIARRGHPPACHLSGNERPLKLGAEPGPEFLVVSQSTPDARDRGVELDGLLNAITHKQPSGCLLIAPMRINGNHFVAYL